MPAGVVVVFRNPVKAQYLVRDWQRKLRCINGTFLQRLKYFAAGQHGDGGSGALHNLAAYPCKPYFQPLHIIQ